MSYLHTSDWCAIASANLVTFDVVKEQLFAKQQEALSLSMLLL
jgi:hypothetical protein